MTARSLRWTAFAIALTIQITAVLIYGVGTRWCFCAITTVEPPPALSTFAIRFMQTGLLPVNYAGRGLALVIPRDLLPRVEVLYIVGLLAWFLAVLALLNAIVFAARVRVGRGMRLTGRESVRPAHLLIGVCILLVAAMAAGAMQRRAWLRQAEQVFTATMAATHGGGPPPPGVEFSMYAVDGDTSYLATPERRFETRVDARMAGDHFLDQFVVPYEYGGLVRFESGARYSFSVSSTKNGWSVFLHQPIARLQREPRGSLTPPPRAVLRWPRFRRGTRQAAR